MRPIKLAVIFDQQIHAGGGYQQALNAAILAKELSQDSVEVLFYTTVECNIQILRCHGITATLLKTTVLDTILDRFRATIVSPSILKLLKKLSPNTTFESRLLKDKVDLVYFLSPTHLVRSLESLSYITTVWDLSHRDDPEFPEVRNHRQFEIRESNYKFILPGATAILVDSELGKLNLVRRYAIDDCRVHIMPFQAGVAVRNLNDASTVDIRKKYFLETPYIFYPAQFWPHKNHVYILRGLQLLELEHGIKLSVIFSGRDYGNLRYIESLAKSLNIIDRVRFVGFVDNELVPQLYMQAVALVMPTYFGPTNLPPLEAFSLGVPVMYSDRQGLRDQVGEAALLMDLKDPRNMASQLKDLYLKPELRALLIEKGKERVRYFDSIDRIAILKSIIEDFKTKRSCWA